MQETNDFGAIDFYSNRIWSGYKFDAKVSLRRKDSIKFISQAMEIVVKDLKKANLYFFDVV